MDTSKKGKGGKKAGAAAAKATPAPAPAAQESKPEIVTVQDMEVSDRCCFVEGKPCAGASAAALTAQQSMRDLQRSSQKT